MSEPQAAAAAPLLARKGLAGPAGRAQCATPGLDRIRIDRTHIAGSIDPVNPVYTYKVEQIHAVDGIADGDSNQPRSALEAAALSRSEAAPPKDAGLAPAASLLPIDFLGAGERPVDPARLSTEAPGLAADDPKTEIPPAASGAPRADPAWRIAPERRRAGRGLPALAAALALAALLGAGWQAQRAGWLDVEAPTAAAPAVGGETLAQDAPEPASAMPEQNLETAAAPAEASEPDTPEPIQPAIDVARVEPDGTAVIAGRAAPGAELIVLDNGLPIGTASADAFGEWVFIPATPLARGAHEFGLVIKKVWGGASVPAPDTRRPEAERGSLGTER